ncbi:MAG: hypothetical protein CL908_15475 [Deltaproteobacteria bacterium]|nr:hypothetical protein [Deltaproteobacteria bacterium]
MAAGLAAELKASFDVEARLIKGGNGVFEVRLDGELVFDKARTERFPILGEVSRTVQEQRTS